MHRIPLILICAAPLAAQTFDPHMPATVPSVSGKVVESAAFRYIDVKIGDGAPALPGQQYTVHYSGWLRDGAPFDSSIGKDPIVFVQGRREVIAGWEMGFEGMKVGGRRRLFIPYQLAYGEKGRGPIPPKAELIFDVELLAVKDVPDRPAAADLLFSFSGAANQVVQLARAIPEEKYGWRPAPGVRSVQQVFLHIAFGNRLMLHISEGAAKDAISKEIEENRKNEQQPVDKAKVIALLNESFAAVRQTLETARNAGLNRDIDFFGTPTTTRGVLSSINTHIAEHLGQAIAYARMNGIVPPWSR